MSTTGRGRHSVLPDFQGPPGAHGKTARRGVLFPAAGPYLRRTSPRAKFLRAQLAFKNSMVHGFSAIHTKYRILLRSSSMREPRYPLPRARLWLMKVPDPLAHQKNGATRDAPFLRNPGRNFRFPRSGVSGWPSTLMTRANPTSFSGETFHDETQPSEGSRPTEGTNPVREMGDDQGRGTLLRRATGNGHRTGDEGRQATGTLRGLASGDPMTT
ncbi:hypothetical protein OSB04_un001559 [Centaurea solstitialis]|uniref:Uncharacterized protein n=1 Tax=Centaurea solstitialis TaxID=347529 RepID=A0AA38SFE0_9ASTR|nr:hypothetical protein OSB04_un001559 [Centaurea solstitialis]